MGPTRTFRKGRLASTVVLGRGRRGAWHEGARWMCGTSLACVHSCAAVLWVPRRLPSGPTPKTRKLQMERWMPGSFPTCMLPPCSARATTCDSQAPPVDEGSKRWLLVHLEHPRRGYVRIHLPMHASVPSHASIAILGTRMDSARVPPHPSRSVHNGSFETVMIRNRFDRPWVRSIHQMDIPRRTGTTQPPRRAGTCASFASRKR